MLVWGQAAVAREPITTPTTWYLCILDSSDCVGDAWSCSDSGNTSDASEACNGVGCKHGRHFVAHVNNANAARLGCHQDGANVATYKRKHLLHTMRQQHIRNQVATMAASLLHR